MEVANWDLVHIQAVGVQHTLNNQHNQQQRVKHVVVTLKCGCSMKMTGDKFIGDHNTVVAHMRRWVGNGREIACRNCDRDHVHALNRYES